MLRETDGILKRPEDVVELDIEPVVGPRPFARGVVGTRDELLLTDMVSPGGAGLLTARTVAGSVRPDSGEA